MRAYYIFVVQGKYPGGNGWEDVDTRDSRREALQICRDYDINEPEFKHRVKRRRCYG